MATVNSSVQVSGDYSGSVPINGGSGPIQLTLRQALELGLKANLGPITANNGVRTSRAERIQALSARAPRHLRQRERDRVSGQPERVWLSVQAAAGAEFFYSIGGGTFRIFAVARRADAFGVRCGFEAELEGE